VVTGTHLSQHVWLQLEKKLDIIL
jgi:hypothetical protein